MEWNGILKFAKVVLDIYLENAFFMNRSKQHNRNKSILN